jgi:hypothetical protein
MGGHLAEIGGCQLLKRRAELSYSPTKRRELAEVMLTNQHLFRPEESMSDVNAKVPPQISAEVLRTYDAQTHEIFDAIAATVINAQAGLNWLRAQPVDLEEVRRALNSVAKDGKRAGESVVGLRALMNKLATADGGSDP